MQRLLAEFKDIKNGRIEIREKKQLHYLKNVLRLKGGERLVIFDERSNEYDAGILSLSAEGAVLSVRPIEKKPGPAGIRLAVACAIPKKSKMDDIIDKLTQLGVERIIPLETERVIIRLDSGKKKERLERWKKIAVSAAQQSQRRNIPAIEKIQGVKEALDNFKGYDFKLIPTLSGKRVALKEAILKSRPASILVFIGPEGDFSGIEVELAKGCGCIPVTLGELVLRVETAAVAVASFIRFYAHY